jgi:hypothetical protein
LRIIINALKVYLFHPKGIEKLDQFPLVLFFLFQGH